MLFRSKTVKQVLHLRGNGGTSISKQPNHQPSDQQVNDGRRYAPGDLQAFVDQVADRVKQKRNDEGSDHQLEILVKADNQCK